MSTDVNKVFPLLNGMDGYTANMTTTSNFNIAIDDLSTTSRKKNCTNVHDITYNKPVRLITLYTTIIFGIIGGSLVLIWMRYNRRLNSRVSTLSRVNSLILNLTVSDLAVTLLAVLPQLIWEYFDREWIAGALMCKLVKFLQVFSMMASTNMLVVIALDRHQAIRSPLREPIAVWKMAGVGWALAVVCATPMFFVFRLNVVDDTTRCENIFRDLPMSHRQAFLTYAAIVVFLVPLFILIVCYVRIFMKIAQKAHEHQNSKKHSIKPGKVQLQSTPSSSLPKAKIKTLKMTFVIVVAFVVCGLPYFVAEMIMSYGDHCILSQNIYGLLGGIAAANSSANPFVFLLFNANCKCIRDLKKCRGRANSPQKRYIYSSVNSRSEISNDRSNSHVYKWSHTKYDNVEMSSIN